MKYIVEPKSRGFDVVDTTAVPRADGIWCYCADIERAQVIAKLLNDRDDRELLNRHARELNDEGNDSAAYQDLSDLGHDPPESVVQATDVSVLRSRLMHACVAKRLLREPALAVQALKRLEKLREINPHGRRYHDRWQELLQGPSVELVRVMNECSEMADELRKESPMSVFVSPVERQRIFEATRAASSEEDASPDSSHRPPWEELRALGGSTRVTANESVWTDEENGRGR